jgi:hypothetical protein
MSKPTPPKKVGGKDLEMFRAAHDRSFIIPRRIKDALATLGESWEYEAEFIKRCGLSQSDFALYRDQFADFFVETANSHRSRGKRVWAGSKAFATRLRGVVA